MPGISIKLLDFVRQPFSTWHVSHCGGLGDLLARRLRDADQMREKHSDTFSQLSATIPPETVSKWETMVLNWKNDKSKPNPYDEPRACTIPFARAFLSFLT
jgi:hypothetical protein